MALQESTLDTSGSGALSFGGLTAATFGGLTGSDNLALGNNAAAAVTLSVGNNNQNTTYSGDLSGSGGLTKVGAGILTLSGSNTYRGATIVNAGTLQLATTGVLGPTPAVTLNNAGATLAVNYGGPSDFSPPAGRRAAGRDYFRRNDHRLGLDTTNAGGGATYGGTLAMPAGLTKLGTGTLVLNQSNAYTGTTTISGGTLSVANIADSGPSNLGGAGNAISFSGGGATLQFTGPSAATSRNVSIGGLSTGTINLPTGAITLGGAVTGNYSTLAQTGSGTLTLSGTADNTGTWLNLSGGTAMLTKSSD